MNDLFEMMEPPDALPRYPQGPGFAKGVDTSAAAAAAMVPHLKGLQAKALHALRDAGERGLTALELADVLGVDRMAIQPRTTELKLQGLIRDSRMRRPNPSGKSAIVWVAVNLSAANDQRGEVAA